MVLFILRRQVPGDRETRRESFVVGARIEADPEKNAPALTQIALAQDSKCLA